jgi:hypothetical protein
MKTKRATKKCDYWRYSNYDDGIRTVYHKHSRGMCYTVDHSKDFLEDEEVDMWECYEISLGDRPQHPKRVFDTSNLMGALLKVKEWQDEKNKKSRR